MTKRLCAIYGLTKSTFDLEEGKNLVEQIIKMKEYSTRDDIYSFLLSKDMEKEIAFEITEFIRKGIVKVHKLFVHNLNINFFSEVYYYN